MRRKYIQERASVLNTASAKSGKPFIINAANATLPQVETASFGCKSCSAEFSSIKGSEPFCVNCGSEDVTQIKALAQAVPKTDASLCAIACRSCGTNNILSDVTASLFNGHMHCVECGSQLSYDVDDLQDPISDADETSIEQTLNTESAYAREKARTSAKTKANKVKAENNQLPEPPVVEPIVDLLADETLIEHADLEQEESGEGCAYTEASLAAVVLATNPKARLTLATSENEILAFADGIPIARLTKDNNSEHAAVFHTQSFMQSIARVSETQGIRAALSSYKFTAIRVKFPVSAAVRAKVANTLKAETAAVQEIANNHKEDLLQCVSIASSALTKNLFRTKSNALKRGFIDMLTTAGVKNAALMVDRVFAANADAYHKQVFELAQELQSKSVDYRNTIAESMGDMNGMPSEMPADDTEEVIIEHAGGAALDKQMESAAVRSVVRASVMSGVSNISNIRAAAGGKLF